MDVLPYRKPMASVILSSWPFRSLEAEVLSKDTRSEMDMARFPHPTSTTDLVESKKLDFFPGSDPHENLLLTKKDMVVDWIFKEKSRIILESLTWSDDMSSFFSVLRFVTEDVLSQSIIRSQSDSKKISSQKVKLQLEPAVHMNNLLVQHVAFQ